MHNNITNSVVYPDPDPYIIIKQKTEEKLWLVLFCDFFMTFYLLRLTGTRMYNVPSKCNKQKSLAKQTYFW